MARVSQIYTLDALLAVTLILTATLLVGQFSSSGQPEFQTQYAAQDTLRGLNAIPLGDMSGSLASQLVNETLLEADDSLLYAMGLLWALNDSRAYELAELANASVPARFGMRVSIDGDELFVRARDSETYISSSMQQITGLAQGQPAAGTSSSAYLTRVRDKSTSSFSLFGGFIGQGNISRDLVLPADVNASRISSLTLELDTPQEFELLLNGVSCGSFTPETAEMQPDVFNVSSCSSLLGAGNNSVQLLFDDLVSAYVSGGFLRADYTTDELLATSSYSTTRYNFPRIDGVVNVYDGFLVPQTLTSLEARLRYNASKNTTYTYLSVGEKTVYEQHGAGEFDVLLTDENFSLLDYNRLSNTTVPIRFASVDVNETVIQGADADVVLVTDYSGSMKKSVQDWSQGSSGNVKECESVFEDENIRRTHLARCLNKDVVDMLFEYSGNRLWPTHFVSDEVYTYNNPEDYEALIGYYETFTSEFPQQGSGKTCIACALSEAYEIFSEQSSPNRSRSIILMSDGLPTHCTAAGCSGRSSEYGSLICEGVCDVEGQNCNDWEHMCADDSCAPAIDNTLRVAQELYDEFNVTIHAVGFGPVDTCSQATQVLVDLAELTNGTYAWSNDPQALRDIYQDIAVEILDGVQFESQTVLVGNESAPSQLFDGSYITATHDEAFIASGQQEISLTRQTDFLAACSDTVEFPEELTIESAMLTSYSGSHWTDQLVVNDVTVYNLTEYFVTYQRLGDPYRLLIPNDLLGVENELFVRTADSPDNVTACSEYNSVIYTARVPAASASTPVLERAEGCVWTIENVDGSTYTAPIPGSYEGSNTCSYTSQEVSYDSLDSLQVAVYSLLEQLDFFGDGTIFVSLEAEDLEIVLSEVGGVPFLWGPALVQVEVWQ